MVADRIYTPYYLDVTTKYDYMTHLVFNPFERLCYANEKMFFHYFTFTSTEEQLRRVNVLMEPIYDKIIKDHPFHKNQVLKLKNGFDNAENYSIKTMYLEKTMELIHSLGY